MEILCGVIFCQGKGWEKMIDFNMVFIMVFIVECWDIMGFLLVFMLYLCGVSKVEF